MESKCFSCKNKNVKTSYGYTTCNYSGSECRNFELYDPINKTNADRIRAMTDEELASWLVHKIEDFEFDGYDERVNAWLNWLKQEAVE